MLCFVLFCSVVLCRQCVSLHAQQWCGEGLAAADVAYVMCTSLEPSLLWKERELLDHYHAELCRGLEARFGKPPPVGEEDEGADGGDRSSSWYPWEQFVDDYRVAFLDYMRYVKGDCWPE